MWTSLPEATCVSHTKGKIRWFDTTVRFILQHEVYTSNLVAQRQTHIFKVDKSVVRPKEEWVIIEDMFELIVESMRQSWKTYETGTGTAIEKKFSLEKRLGKVEKVIVKLYEDYALGKTGMDEIDLLLPKYRKEQGELKAQLALFDYDNIYTLEK